MKSQARPEFKPFQCAIWTMGAFFPGSESESTNGRLVFGLPPIGCCSPCLLSSHNGVPLCLLFYSLLSQSWSGRRVLSTNSAQTKKPQQRNRKPVSRAGLFQYKDNAITRGSHILFYINVKLPPLPCHVSRACYILLLIFLTFLTNHLTFLLSIALHF